MPASARLDFGTTREALRRYFADRRDGVFGFHFAELVPFEHGPEELP